MEGGCVFKWKPLCSVFCIQDMEKFESEVKNLQVSLEQVQSTLTSPELTRLTLKDQLSHRQVAASQHCNI